MIYRKSPDFKNCVLNFTSTIDECLDEGEKDTKNILQSVTEALLLFVCHDEGDRIACKIFGCNFISFKMGINTYTKNHYFFKSLKVPYLYKLSLFSTFSG